MARIRTVKPEFFRDEKLQDIQAENPSLNPMLVFEGLWTVADREGRFAWQPRTLKLDVLPFLDFDMAQTLELLSGIGCISKYEVGGKDYGFVANWTRHQLPGRDEAPSEIPSPEGALTPYDRPPNATVRVRLYERDRYKCVYCDRDLRKDTRAICLDHVIPYSQQGSNRDVNLVTACKKCNAIKMDRTPKQAKMVWPVGFGESLVDGIYTYLGPPVNGSGPPVNGSVGSANSADSMADAEGVRGRGRGRDRDRVMEGVREKDGNQNPAAQNPEIGDVIDQLVHQVASLHPRVLNAFNLTQEVACAIAEAIARDGYDLVWAGTKCYSEATSKWTATDRGFMAKPAVFFRDSEYRRDPKEWERNGRTKSRAEQNLDTILDARETARRAVGLDH